MISRFWRTNFHKSPSLSVIANVILQFIGMSDKIVFIPQVIDLLFCRLEALCDLKDTFLTYLLLQHCGYISWSLVFFQFSYQLTSETNLEDGKCDENMTGHSLHFPKK